MVNKKAFNNLICVIQNENNKLAGVQLSLDFYYTKRRVEKTGGSEVATACIAGFAALFLTPEGGIRDCPLDNLDHRQLYISARDTLGISEQEAYELFAPRDRFFFQEIISWLKKIAETGEISDPGIPRGFI